MGTLFFWDGVVALLFATQHPTLTKNLMLGSVGLRPNTLMREMILKGTSLRNSDRQQMAHIIIDSFGKDLAPTVHGIPGTRT